MKNFTAYSIAVLLLLFVQFAGAANISSTPSGGFWNSPSTWAGNVVPSTADNVTIISGSTVTVNLNISCFDLIVQGILNNTNYNITLMGNLDVSGTMNTGTGLLTVSGTGKTINGNVLLSGLTINGTYTNLGTLTVTGNLSGSGSLAQNTNSNLFLQGNVTLTNLNASVNPNTVTYNGTGAVSIKSITYFNLVINTTGNASLEGVITVNGNIDIQNGSLNDNGNQITGNISGTLNMSSGTLLTVGNLSSASNFPSNYTSLNIILDSNSIVKYNSSIPQNISNIPVYANLDLISSSTVTKNVSGNLIVKRTLTIGTFNNLNMGTYSLTIFKDFINNGNFSSNGDVTFAGLHDQIIGGSFPTAFYNLTINKTDSLVNLLIPTSVNGQLLLTNGKILTSNINKLSINSGGFVNGGSNISYVEGPLQKNGNSSFTFPVGKNGVFQPISISAPASASDAFVAEYFNHNPNIDGIATNSVQTGLDHVSKAEYWNLTRYIGISNVTVSLFWNTGSGVTSLPDLQVAGWNGSLWMNYGGNSNGSTSSGNVTSTGTPSNYSAFTLASVTTQNLLGGMTHSISSTNVSCNGANDGNATVNISGGTSPYTFSWSNGQTTQVAMNLAAGTYNVTIKDVSLDSLVGSISITQPNILILAENHTNISCNGGSDGIITIFSSGGNSPYQYSINNGTTFVGGNFFNTLSAGTYQLKVKDANNCITNPVSVSLVPPPALITNAGNPGTICIGYNFDIGGVPTASGGTPGYTFNWSSIPTGFTSTSSNPTVAPSLTTQYMLTVTDANGCVSNASVNVTLNPLPNVNTGSDISICDGSSATINANAFGNTYSWSPATGLNDTLIVNPEASPSVTTSYVMSVTDINGCTNRDTVMVTVIPLPDVVATPNTQSICSGLSANIGLSSSISGTSFNWTVSQNNVSGGTTGGGISISELLTNNGTVNGTATYTITPVSNGCAGSPVNADITVYPQSFGGSVIATPSSVCINSSTMLSLSANTGTIIWQESSDGSTWSDITGETGSTYSTINLLTTTYYRASVISGVGCTPAYSLATTVIVNPLPLADAGIDQSICSGQSAILLASGGNLYLWGNGNSTATINVSPSVASTYTVTVTDANGCFAIDSINVFVTQSTTSTLTQEACESYILNGTTYNTSGVYTQTLVNAVGCDSVITLNITIKNTTTLSLIQTACNYYTLNGNTYEASGIYTQTFVNAAGCDSVITLDLTINYSTVTTLTEVACDSYLLNGITYTTSGAYVQTIVNAAGCDSVITLNLTINPLPLVLFTGLPISSCAVSQYIMLIGNQSPYGVFSGVGLINNGFNPSVAGGGIHNISYSYTDSNGCSATEVQVVVVNTNPSMQLVSSAQTTCGNANGSATIDGINGTAPYMFNWSTGSINASIFNLLSGVYVITITDSNGCSGVSSVNISSSDGPIITINSTTNSSCNYSFDGTADITVTGGAEPYTYLWTDGETTEDALYLAEGTNSVTVTDINNCNSVTSVNTMSTYGTPVIFGRISYYGGYIDGQYATLKIFSLINNNQGGYDTTSRNAVIGSDGTYVLYNFEPGEYILKVLLQSNPYPGLLNSYYTTDTISTHKWQAATPVTLGCGQDIEANIFMYEHLNTGIGNGQINGTIVQNNTGSKSKGVHINPGKLAGEPVPGAEIYVELEPDDQPIANTETDSSGFYSFEELPDGGYSIRVEIPGFPMISTYQVIITPTDTAFPDLDFIVDYTADSGFVDTSLVFINNKPDEASTVSVYPNPFIETVNVSYTITKSNVICIDVYDATGRLLETTGKILQNEGSYIHNINSEKNELMPGIYFIQFRINNTVYLKKIVKIK